MTVATILLCAGGLALLIVGAELLVRGASRLATRLGMSQLVIGLTVVAFGTSAPELAVALKGTVSDHSGIALGNIVGSNILNVLMILGLSALIAPLFVSRALVRRDVPVMIGVSGIVLVLGLDHRFGRLDGLLLFGGLFVYLVLTIRHEKRRTVPREPNDEARTNPKRSMRGGLLDLAFVLLGVPVMVLGAQWLVDGAASIAKAAGLSDLVIGLTLVALGTSMPEVVTSVTASLRGQRDIAAGNVIGSNLFNLLCVLGLASFLSPGGIDVSAAAIRFDLPIMVVVAFTCLPMFFTGGRISRTEGGILFLYYLAYAGYLVLAATEHDHLPRFSAVMLYFAIPLTLLTLLIVAAGEFGRRRRARPGGSDGGPPGDREGGRS
ncbi:MAG: calcium/sodium antiporter [Candidatus Eisenbacteria bacterium]|nr:calcium/sodium antiporter [Candidatus Latescibacterota bacterium]MBD3303379.1 calcium/sodium antiporter [Candidatus Eisenbacteria bacterium]